LLGVSEHLVDRLLNLELGDEFETLLSKVDWKPSALANLLADRSRASKRAGFDWHGVLGTERVIGTMVWASERRISPRGAHMLLDTLSHDPGLTLEGALEAVKPDRNPSVC